MPDFIFPEVDQNGRFTDPKVIADIETVAKNALTTALAGKRGKNPIELGTEHLDTVTEPEVYSQSANLEAILESGYPTTRAGYLLVERSASRTMVWQTYTTYAASANTPPQTWRRGSYNGTWYAWARLDEPEVPGGGKLGQVLTAGTDGKAQWGPVLGAAANILTGPGRPDQPATTGGIITGSEPVGSEYRSQDGAGAGAWAWRKRPSGWAVTDGDTGWRSVPCIAKSDSPNSSVMTMTALARITSSAVHLEMTVVSNSGTGWQGWAVNDKWLQDNYLNPGNGGTVNRKDAFHLTPALTWGIRPESFPKKVYFTGNSTNGLSAGTWVLSGEFPPPIAWPSTLPGTPA